MGMSRKNLVITIFGILGVVALFTGAMFAIFTDDMNDNDSDTGPEIGDRQTTTRTHSAEKDGYVESEFRQFRFAAIADDAGPCSTIGINVLAKLGGSAVDAAIATMQRVGEAWWVGLVDAAIATIGCMGNLNVLAKLGGSAVDAAIATMVCVGIVNCHSSGVGGGHFMTIYERPRGRTEKVLNTILARERAPLNATQDMFVNASDTASTVGGLAIAVPGEVKGFYRAWQRFGRVPWPRLFEETIQLCKDGHIVNPSLASAIQQYEEMIRADPNLSELFVKEDGTLVQEGDILVRPKMAVTLERIAEDPKAFYEPTSLLAQDIIADIAEYDGIVTLEDLALYEIYDKDPINITLSNGGYHVYGAVAPSSGVIHNYALNILDGYNFTPDSLNITDDAILTYHRIAEAYKFAFAKRSALGDEEFVDLSELMANLTSNDYAEYTRSRIDDNTTHDIWYYEPVFELTEDSGTAHASILASDGSAVSISATINLYFGSKVRGNRTGIFFNDEMDDFSTPGVDNAFGLPPSPSNFIEPGKMPMSSMCPTLVLDDDGVVRFISGAAGGTRITTQTAAAIMDGLWFGFEAGEANERHRFHHQLTPNEVRVEMGFNEDIIAGLVSKGHEIDRSDSIAVTQSIHNKCGLPGADPNACVNAVSDGRKAGVPDGY